MSTNNEFWEKVVKAYYSDASQYLGAKSLCLAKAMLISAVCIIPLSHGHKQHIPGEKETWNDLRWDSITFLTGVGDVDAHFTIPRLLWSGKSDSLQDWVRNDCNFALGDLLPTLHAL
jgi:hypothetical protein